MHTISNYDQLVSDTLWNWILFSCSWSKATLSHCKPHQWVFHLLPNILSLSPSPCYAYFLFVGIEVELHAWNFINSLCCNCNECLELCHHLHLHLFHEILIDYSTSIHLGFLIELFFHSNNLLLQTRLNLWLFSWLALSETSISSPRHPIVILPNVISSPTTFAFWFVDFWFMDLVNYRFVINRLTCWVVWLKCTCFGKLLKFNIDWHEEILVVPMSILLCWSTLTHLKISGSRLKVKFIIHFDTHLLKMIKINFN